jgi:hypothetical protein
MRGRNFNRFLALTLALLIGAGCSGVLYESKSKDGREDRLRIDKGESWSTYDDKPRKPDSKAKKDRDDNSLLLKNEVTF